MNAFEDIQRRLERAQKLASEMLPVLRGDVGESSDNALDWEVAISLMLVDNADVHVPPQNVVRRVAMIPPKIRALLVRLGDNIMFGRRLSSTSAHQFEFYTEAQLPSWRIGRSACRMEAAASESDDLGTVPSIAPTGAVSARFDGTDLVVRISNPHELDNTRLLELSWWSTDTDSDYADTVLFRRRGPERGAIEARVDGLAGRPCVCGICDRIP